MAERMQFSYEALDRSGNKVSGSLEAGSDGEATRRLAQQGLTPYALKRARGAAWAGPRRKHASARELQLVLHEFSTIPGVREDVIEILMNLKHVPVRSHSREVRVLRLELDGPG